MSLHELQRRPVDRQLAAGTDSCVAVQPSPMSIAGTDENRQHKCKVSLGVMALQSPSVSARKTYKSLITKDLFGTCMRPNDLDPLKKAGFQCL